MKDINRGTEIFGWRIYSLSSPERQKEILDEIDLDKNLPLCTWKGQVGLLDGAPEEILLAYLSKVYWKAQVELFNNLPAKSLDKAESLLDDRAKRALKIEVKKPKKTRWTYKAML